MENKSHVWNHQPDNDYGNLVPLISQWFLLLDHLPTRNLLSTEFDQGCVKVKHLWTRGKVPKLIARSVHNKVN